MTTPLFPLVQLLDPAPAVGEALAKLAPRKYCLLLESAQRHPQRGRYSFLAVDPFEFLRISVGESDPLEMLRQKLDCFSASPHPELPPFQGGAAGLFGYELARSLEPRVPAARFDEFHIPALAIGLYDLLIAWDHAAGKCWIVSQGFPEQEANARREKAADRIAQMRQWLKLAAAAPSQQPQSALAFDLLAPQFSTRQPGVTSTFSQPEYLQAVAKAVEYIRAGDIFQVNLSQRLLAPAATDSLSLYQRLRQTNPAPFCGYFDLGDIQIISSSPERFLQLRNRRLEARPIKGTRRRWPHPIADLYVADDLIASEKDRSENVMILDLLRNDLSRVCRADSVQVTQLCEVEVYQFVQHLVSAVAGELKEHCTPIDVIRAAFPGGSITGAPKVRSMEIIAEMEPVARGAYCGSLGYLGFDGALDLSILIRTITAAAGWWQFSVGGGIVSASDPRSEYEETWHKAEGLLRGLA